MRNRTFLYTAIQTKIFPVKERTFKITSEVTSTVIRKELRELRLSAIIITKMSARINVVNVQYTLDLYYSAKPVLTEVIIGQRLLPCQRSAPKSIKIAVHCYTEAFSLGFL